MIKVNDYIEIAFYKWLLGNKVDIDSLNEDQKIHILIDNYLYENTRNWGLRLFIKLFQDYTVFETREFGVEIDLGEQFRFFCLNDLRYVMPETIDKRTRLHPYLGGFVNFLKDDGRYKQINDNLLNIAQRVYQENLGLERWFKQATRDVGEYLVGSFDVYQDITLTYNDLEDYFLWLRSKSHVTPEEYSFSINDRRNFLESVVSFESVKLFDWKSRPDRAYSYKMLPNGDYVILEFLHKLEHHKLDINRITFPLLLKYIDLFCEEHGKEHRKTLVSFVKNIKKDNSLASSILHILNKNKSKGLSIDRLNIPKLHGILLFPKHSNLTQFMNQYLEDIHYMTSDTMDIYYTKDDIKHNASCYKKVKQLVYMNKENNQFPAMLVWEKFGGPVETIVLKGLTHQEIFDVIEFLKNSIDLRPVNDSLKLTISFINDILKSKKIGSDTIYNINNSQIGAVGDKSSSTSIFKQ